MATVEARRWGKSSAMNQTLLSKTVNCAAKRKCSPPHRSWHWTDLSSLKTHLSYNMKPYGSFYSRFVIICIALLIVQFFKILQLPFFVAPLIKLFSYLFCRKLLRPAEIPSSRFGNQTIFSETLHSVATRKCNFIAMPRQRLRLKVSFLKVICLKALSSKQRNTFLSIFPKKL